MIAIIAAMDAEIAGLKEAMTEKNDTVSGFARITSGTLEGQRIALCRCGIGKVHAALAAQALILSHHPDVLLNTGVAGALYPEAAIADTVVGTACVQHDMDTTPIGDPKGLISGINKVYLPCDDKLADLIYASALAAGGACRRGVIATGDQFVGTAEGKSAIQSQFHALVCDMEGGAIAQTALEYGVPFAAYRCVSDTLAGSGEEYTVNLSAAVERSHRILKEFLTRLKG